MESGCVYHPRRCLSEGSDNTKAKVPSSLPTCAAAQSSHAGCHAVLLLQTKR